MHIFGDSSAPWRRDTIDEKVAYMKLAGHPALNGTGDLPVKARSEHKEIGCWLKGDRLLAGMK